MGSRSAGLVGHNDFLLWALGNHRTACKDGNDGNDMNYFALLRDHSGERRRERVKDSIPITTETSGSQFSTTKEASVDNTSKSREDAERNQVCDNIAEPLELASPKFSPLTKFFCPLTLHELNYLCCVLVSTSQPMRTVVFTVSLKGS